MPCGKTGIIFSVILVVSVNIIGCSFNEGDHGNSNTSEYMSLLEKFPLDAQGKGFDPYFTSVETHQATTYAQVLSSESFHYKNSPNIESRQRITKAVSWLLENADLDGDGKPGWGLPFAWDAFGDGSINPVNQPYTIDTAIVAIGLMDALEIEGFWSDEEKQQIILCLHNVFTRWCNEAFTELDANTGYYWYSTNQADNFNVINVSSMFAGVQQKFIRFYGYILSKEELDLYNHCMDSVARMISENAFFLFDCPYWIYNSSDRLTPITNDLVHHVYILFGMEMYRANGGKELLSWTIKQGVESLDLFLVHSELFNYPQDLLFSNPLINSNDPANLWGIGMTMAYVIKSGDIEKYEQCNQIVLSKYGIFPDVTIYPTDNSAGVPFYPRYAAHLLYGLAVKEFREDSF
jgi:hypothetical protein